MKKKCDIEAVTGAPCILVAISDPARVLVFCAALTFVELLPLPVPFEADISDLTRRAICERISHTKRRSTACEMTCCSIKPRSGYAIWHSGQQNSGDPSSAFVSRIWPGFGRALPVPVAAGVEPTPFASSPLAPVPPPFSVLLLELCASELTPVWPPPLAIPLSKSFCTLNAFVSTPIKPLSGPGELRPEPATDPLFGSFLIVSEYFSRCCMEMGSVADSRCEE
uniref:Uncharacterized protein n=1 Tax=Anopheles culicifacies TaxID=139723 RepID=A0A182MHW7_9DIPT